MISKDKLLFIAVIVSILGTASLFLFTASSGVKHSRISEIDENFVGRKVMVTGTVAESYSYEDTMYIELKENESSKILNVKVAKDRLEKVDNKEEIKPGAVISVRGFIKEYEGDYTLNVEESYGIELEKKACYSYTEISSLLENPEWYEGMNVKVRGEVVNDGQSYGGYDMEICPLGGGYKQVNCHIEEWSPASNETFLKKTPVVVKGEYRYDSYSGRWEIVSDTEPMVYRE